MARDATPAPIAATRLRFEALVTLEPLDDDFDEELGSITPEMSTLRKGF
jgi:hypothetical protein